MTEFVNFVTDAMWLAVVALLIIELRIMFKDDDDDWPV